MRTTEEILDAAKAAIAAASDYRLAKELETTTGHITNWRAKKSQPNNEMVYRLAIMLQEDPGLILAEIEHDFAKTPERAAWWADFLAHGVRLGWVAVLCACMGGSGSGAGFGSGGGKGAYVKPHNVYYVK